MTYEDEARNLVRLRDRVLELCRNNDPRVQPLLANYKRFCLENKIVHASGRQTHARILREKGRLDLIPPDLHIKPSPLHASQVPQVLEQVDPKPPVHSVPSSVPQRPLLVGQSEPCLPYDDGPSAEPVAKTNNKPDTQNSSDSEYDPETCRPVSTTDSPEYEPELASPVPDTPNPQSQEPTPLVLQPEPPNIQPHQYHQPFPPQLHQSYSAPPVHQYSSVQSHMPHRSKYLKPHKHYRHPNPPFSENWQNLLFAPTQFAPNSPQAQNILVAPPLLYPMGPQAFYPMPQPQMFPGIPGPSSPSTRPPRRSKAGRSALHKRTLRPLQPYGPVNSHQDEVPMNY